MSLFSLQSPRLLLCSIGSAARAGETQQSLITCCPQPLCSQDQPRREAQGTNPSTSPRENELSSRLQPGGGEIPKLTTYGQVLMEEEETSAGEQNRVFRACHCAARVSCGPIPELPTGSPRLRPDRDLSGKGSVSRVCVCTAQPWH